MTRVRWPVPEASELRKQVMENNAEELTAREQRLVFLYEEFGPPSHMFLAGGIPAMFAIRELKWCYLCGCYLATVLTAQVFIEHSLGGAYLGFADAAIVSGGFKRLIDQSLQTGYITPELATRLHGLRTMRNPYTHPKAGTAPGGYMARLAQMGLYDPEEMAENDAREAIRIVVDFLREGSPSWVPDHGWSSTTAQEDDSNSQS